MVVSLRFSYSTAYSMLRSIIIIIMQFITAMENIGHVSKISVSGYGDRRFKTLLHQYVVSLSKTLNPHCFCRLNCEISTRRLQTREGCLFSAMSIPKEIALRLRAFCGKLVSFILAWITEVYQVP